MDDAPLPATLTPKEEISESFDIKQDKNIYKLDIKIINQDITLNLKDKKELILEYENKFTLDELKKMHRVFLPLNLCQEFLDYLKALITNNKLSIKRKAENKIYIELNVEYLFKQNTIIIDLFQKKINFELIAQDLYKKFSSLTENFKTLELNYKNILQEDKKIKEENNYMKNEIEKLKNENKENKSQKEKIINNINKKFEEMEKKYELLKKENMDYKNEIRKIKEIISSKKENKGKSTVSVEKSAQVSTKIDKSQFKPEELTDPDCLDCLQTLSVLNFKLKKYEDIRDKIEGRTPKDLMQKIIKIRCKILNLENSLGDEISPTDYLILLKFNFDRDKKLAEYFKQIGDKDKFMLVQERIPLIENEIGELKKTMPKLKSG